MHFSQSLVVATSFLLSACGAKWHASTDAASTTNPTPGSATIQTTLPGLSLTSQTGVAIARMRAPTTQIKLAVSGMTCTSTLAVDRVTIDLGAQQLGTYTIVKGYPTANLLASFQARAHACNGSADPTADVSSTGCHEEVLSGEVTITRFDAAAGGVVEGTIDIVFSDGEVSSDFSAQRCD